MEIIGRERNHGLDKTRELIRAIENLDEENTLRLCHEFLTGNPNDLDKKRFKNAMKEGVALVTESYESGGYGIEEIIVLRDILEEILSRFEDYFVK